MTSRYEIRLSVYDRQSGEDWHMAVGSDEFPVFSEHLVDDLRAPAGFSLRPDFDQTVRILKKRQFRRDLLLEAARKLAARLGDFLEDKEGWHGEGRRDTIKKLSPRR